MHMQCCEALGVIGWAIAAAERLGRGSNSIGVIRNDLAIGRRRQQLPPHSPSQRGPRRRGGPRRGARAWRGPPRGLRRGWRWWSAGRCAAWFEFLKLEKARDRKADARKARKREKLEVVKTSGGLFRLRIFFSFSPSSLSRKKKKKKKKKKLAPFFLRAMPSSTLLRCSSSRAATASMRPTSIAAMLGRNRASLARKTTRGFSVSIRQSSSPSSSPLQLCSALPPGWVRWHFGPSFSPEQDSHLF